MGAAKTKPMSLSSTKPMTRRKLLQVGGAITLVVAGGGLWRASEQGVFAVGSGPAYEPWHNWQVSTDRSPLNLVRAAILAANAHNTQPWLFHVTDTAIQVYADTGRNVGAMDSLRREMYISLGCALENLSLAAPPNGFDARIRLMPAADDPTYAADVALTPRAAQHSALYEAIPHRHTNRAAFDTARPVSPETLQCLSDLAASPETKLQWFLSSARRRWISDLTVKATEAIIADEEMCRDSERWFRLSWTDLQQKRDGITLDAQGMSPALTALAKMGPPLPRSRTDALWLQTTRDRQVATAGAYGMIAVADFSNKAHLLQAGRLWQRLHLAAAAHGLAMQPLNQIIERADREVQEGLAPRFGDELQELVGGDLWRGVFLFRMGYPRQTALPSPRRSVAEILC